jgi:hypothetical protein
MRLPYLLLFLCTLLFSCSKEERNGNGVISDYAGTYRNFNYAEEPIGNFGPGIYDENSVPGELKDLQFGRIEISFRYNGGGLEYFMPLLYYGSINKDPSDDDSEEPKFHLAVEIGHYNVIPFPVEYLFYTICTYRQPQYCRDTFSPFISGSDYTFVIDKRPEGLILQLKKGENILNIFPHAFFPDSAQMFFKDVTSYTEKNRGDSLTTVLMVGKGFAGIDRGIHELNGEVTNVSFKKYVIPADDSGYELKYVRNQHLENQQITFVPRDKQYGSDRYVALNYQFFPYQFSNGEMVPSGEMKTGESERIVNGNSFTCFLGKDDIGFYKVNISTTDKNNNLIRSSVKAFEIWVYPREWDFEFYKQ